MLDYTRVVFKYKFNKVWIDCPEKKLKMNTYTCLKRANKLPATTSITPQRTFLTQDNNITFCSLQFIFSAVVFASYNFFCLYIFLDSTESEDKDTRFFPWCMERTRKKQVKKRKQ